MKRPSSYFTPLSVCVLLTLLGSSAQAQVRTWDGGGTNSNWSTANNWSSNNVPDTTNEAALFTNDPVGQTKLTPNLSASVTNGQVQFSATAPSYTITNSGGSILYLKPGGGFGVLGITVASGAANQTVSVEVWLLTNQTWEVEGTTTLTVSGEVEDDSVINYALTKTGTGTLVLSGDARYDGGTTINGGSLVMSYNITSMAAGFTVNAGILRATTSANALGNMANNTVTLAGGALELANDLGLAFNRNTTVSSNATIRSDRLTAGAGVTHTLGTLKVGAQTLSVTAGANVTTGTAGLTFGTTTLTAGPAIFDVASNANLTLGAVGGVFNMTKQGSGRLTLNTTGTRTTAAGTTTLTAGTLRLGTANALNTSATANLNLNGGTLSLGVTANTTFGGTATSVGGTTTVEVDRATSGAPGPTHTLGTLSIGANTLSVVSGTNITANNIYGLTFGATTLTGDAIFNVANNGTGIGTLTLGVIGETGGPRALTKTGTGTLVLTGATANTYSGATTVSGGTLALGATGSISNTPSVDVRGGCTLDVSGVSGGFVLQPAQTLLGNGKVVGNVTAATTIRGTLSPGDSIGTLNHIGNLVLTGTAVLNYELGASNDLTVVTGNLTLDGTLNITDAGGFGVGTYTLISYTGSLVNNGLGVGTTPNPGLTYTIDVGTAGLVKLNVTGGAVDPFVTWQNQYFPGGGPNAAAGADPDGDGMSNTNEFLAGFDPTNKAAYLHIISIAKSGADMNITYLGANGNSTTTPPMTSRTNVLEYTTGAEDGNYSNNFTSTGQTNVLSGGTGLGVVTNLVDIGGATNTPSRYYRVRVLVP